MGIWLFANGVRPEPVARSPVLGSKTCPLPGPPKASRYSLKSQKPGVALAAFVAGLQDWTTVGVGTVYRLVIPAVCLVP